MRLYFVNYEVKRFNQKLPHFSQHATSGSHAQVHLSSMGAGNSQQLQEWSASSSVGYFALAMIQAPPLQTMQTLLPYINLQDKTRLGESYS